MIHVILNSASGPKPQTDSAGPVADAFRKAGLEIRLHQPAPSEIATVVAGALNEDARCIVAGGGDGTVSAVAAAVVDNPTPMGLLPLGTLNHFAKDLGIPPDLDGAVRTIAAGHVKSVDVGRVADRVFLNNSSIGVYPSIVERRGRLCEQGHGKWAAGALATLEVLRRADEVTVRIEIDGRAIHSRTPFVFIGNNEYRVDGIHLGERARLDEGRLFVYLAPPVRTRHLPRLFALALVGRAKNDRGLEVVSATEVWIETIATRHVKVACDGELMTLATPLHYRISRHALNVLVPAGVDRTP